MSKSGVFDPTGGEAVAQTLGNFTPALLLGGAAVGMVGTYSGRYVKTGAQVDIFIAIAVSALGSSTGNATISGLPFASSAVANSAKWMPAYFQNSTATSTTFTQTAAQTQQSASTLNLWQVSQAAVTVISITNTNLTNTSIIVVSGTYWTDL